MPAPPATQTLPLANLNWKAIAPYLGRAHGGVARFDAIASNAGTREAILQMEPLLIMQEAVSSSRIEGTQATLEDVLRFQAEKKPAEKHDDILEVINYRNALETSINAMRKLPLSARLLKDAHKILLSGARGRQKDPGNFRSGQVHVGAPGASAEDARYTPPPAQDVPALFSNLEQYIHGDESDALVQLAIVHAQFEIIHPFWDGNGRLGRLLMPLFLYYKNVISTPHFYISEYLEKNRGEYYDRLHRITAAGEWEGWIAFFLHALAEQSGASAARAQKVIDLKGEILARVQAATHSQYTPQISDFLCTNPIFHGVYFRDTAGVPRPSAARLLKLLEKADIIEKSIPGKGRKTTQWCFTELWGLLADT